MSDVAKLLLIAGALAGAYVLWTRFLSPEAKIKAEADAVRDAGGPTRAARAGGGGANLGDATTAMLDAVQNGFGARQEREEAANNAINADVERQLIAQIDAGQWTYTEVDVPPGVPRTGTLEGGRRLKLLIRKRRTDPRAIGTLLGDIARTVFDPSTVSLDLQVGSSSDVFLTRDYLVLNPPWMYDEGDAFAFTDDTHYRLTMVQAPGLPYPNTVRLLAAYEAWTARNRAGGAGGTTSTSARITGLGVAPAAIATAEELAQIAQTGVQTVRVSAPTPTGTYRPSRI